MVGAIPPGPSEDDSDAAYELRVSSKRREEPVLQRTARTWAVVVSSSQMTSMRIAFEGEPVRHSPELSSSVCTLRQSPSQLPSDAVARISAQATSLPFRKERYDFRLKGAAPQQHEGASRQSAYCRASGRASEELTSARPVEELAECYAPRPYCFILRQSVTVLIFRASAAWRRLPRKRSSARSIMARSCA